MRLELTEQHTVKRIDVFGSFARGDAGTESDWILLWSWPIRHSTIYGSQIQAGRCAKTPSGFGHGRHGKIPS